MSFYKVATSDLPTGWIAVPLTDFVVTKSGNSKLIKGKMHHEPAPSLYQAYSASGADVWSDSFEYDSAGVVVSAVGARCGKSFLAKGKWVAVANTHVVLPFADAIDDKFLWYGLNNEDFWIKSGTAQPFVVVSKSFERLFAVPPRVEQVRIVDKLEELLSGLEAGVAELKAAQRKLAQYRQSLLKIAVEGADASHVFPKVMLADLVVSIGQGWSPKCEHDAASDIEQWAVMKTTAIQPLAFDGSHNKVLPKGLKPREHLELKSGDLLVTRAGPRNRVGVTCLVRTTRERLILCDKAYRIRCDETKIDPSFLELVLNAPHMVQRIDELKTGISDSGLNLTQDRFFTLEIPLPALEVQRAVIDKIHHQVELIQNQENSIEISLKQSTAQRQNILKAAFSGQLVPQDPSDEPASELLERIRVERAAQQAVKKPRGRKAKEAA